MDRTGQNRNLVNISRLSLLATAAILVCLLLVTVATAYTDLPAVSDPSDQVNHSVSGQTVVWQDFRNRTIGCPNGQNCISGDIYSLDLATGIEQRLTASSDAMDPDVDGNRVVWRDWTTGKIIVHNLLTGAQTNASLAGGTEQMVTPSISGDIVVWTDYRTSAEYGEIFMRDLNAASDVPVSQASTDPAIPAVKKDKRFPDVDGNIVVWEDWRNATQDQWGWWSNPDIYMKDLSTGIEQPVTTDPSDQYMPAVSDGRVVWMDYRNNNWDVYMYDIATGVESQLTSDPADQNWPSIDGDFVVWKDTRNGNEDIYRLHLGTGIEEAVSLDPASQKMPLTSGSLVAWMDKRAGNWDIYYAGESACTEPELSLSSPTPYWASMGDYNAGVLSADWTLTNNGGNSAYDVQVIGGTTSNGVSLISNLPAILGNLSEGGGSISYTFKYFIPPGVVSFHTATYVAAEDICGNSYAYPGPYPGA